jgi:uncharacterized protein (TIGR02266 family)
MTPLHHGDSERSSTSPLGTPSDRAAVGDRRKIARRIDRLSVKLLALSTEFSSYVGLTENLSEGGTFVATRAPWTVGSTVDLIIGLPHQRVIRARGTVCWRRLASIENGSAPGIGIRFERLSIDDAARIRAFAQS